MKISTRTATFDNVSTKVTKVDAAIFAEQTVANNGETILDNIYINCGGKAVESNSVRNAYNQDVTISRRVTDVMSNKVYDTRMKRREDRSYIKLNDNEPVDIDYVVKDGYIGRHDILPILGIRSGVNVLFPEAPTANRCDINFDTTEDNINMHTDIKLISGEIKSELDLGILPVRIEKCPNTFIKSITSEFKSEKQDTTETETVDGRNTSCTYEVHNDGMSAEYGVVSACGTSTGTATVTVADDKQSVTTNISLHVLPNVEQHIDHEHHVNTKIYATQSGRMNIVSVSVVDDGDVNDFTLIYNNNSLSIADEYISDVDNLSEVLLNSRKVIQKSYINDTDIELKYIDKELDYKRLFALISYGTEFLDYNVVGDVEHITDRIEACKNIEYHLDNYRRLVASGYKKRSVYIEHASAISAATRSIAAAESPEMIKCLLMTYLSVISRLVLSYGGFLGSKTIPSILNNIKCVEREVLC